MASRVKQLEAELEALRQELQAAREKQQSGDEAFRRFSESGIIGIAGFNLSGTLLFANESLLRMFGCTAEEVAAGSVEWERLTPPEWSDRAAAALEELRAHGRCAPHEREYLRCDGSRFWGLFTGVAIGEDAIAFLFDITERKQAEEALRNSENRFRTIFDQSPLSLQVFAPDGASLAANPAWQKLWESTPDQLAGYNLLQDPQVRAKGSLPYIERAFQGEAVTVPAVLYDPAEIGRLGRPHWIEAYLYPVKDEAGGVREVVLLLCDVTARMEGERERAQSLAREQEARAHAEETQRRLTLLTEATGALIGSLHLDRVLTEILALSRRLMDADAYAIWRLDRAAGRWGIAASEGLSEAYRSAVIAALEHTREMPDTPLVVSDIDQEPLLAGHRDLLLQEGIRSMLVSPLSMHAAVGGTLVFYFHQPHRFDDIELKVSGALANLAASAIATTELYEAASLRAEQLVEADRHKDQFLAMLAHELRNPLSAISNAIHVIQRAPPGSAAFQRCREVVERQSQHMARLVDQLLDVSRLSRGKIDLHPQPLDLAGLVSDTCEDHRRVLEDAGLSLTLELPGQPLWVMGDPTRLRQILGNLLQNAAKFTLPGGHVTVGIEVFRYSGVQEGLGQPETPEYLNTEHLNTPSARVTVSDTGVGIAPELLPRLFDPFVQADRSLDRTQGGLGLGLALVKGIAELHGGRVHAQSDGINRGATFSFEIPLQPAVTEAERSAAPAPVTTEALRVLIIEDNVDAAETLRDLVELLGHEVEVAYSGPDGIERARRGRPDVVLCDLGLPGMDGCAVAAALRQDPATRSSRLLAVTGYGQEEDVRRSAEAGFDAHLTKPVPAEHLQQVLLSSAHGVQETVWTPPVLWKTE